MIANIGAGDARYWGLPNGGAVAYARGCPMGQLTAGRKQVLEGDGWGSVPVGGSDTSGVTQG